MKRVLYLVIFFLPAIAFSQDGLVGKKLLIQGTDADNFFKIRFIGTKPFIETSFDSEFVIHAKVQKDNDNSPIFQFVGIANGGQVKKRSLFRVTNNGHEAMEIKADGHIFSQKLALGTKNPTQRLHVEGGAYIKNYLVTPQIKSDEIGTLSIDIDSKKRKISFFHQNTVLADVLSADVNTVLLRVGGYESIGRSQVGKIISTDFQLIPPDTEKFTNTLSKVYWKDKEEKIVMTLGGGSASEKYVELNATRDLYINTKVGIGIKNPAEKLHVNGAAKFNRVIIGETIFSRSFDNVQQFKIDNAKGNIEIASNYLHLSTPNIHISGTITNMLHVKEGIHTQGKDIYLGANNTDTNHGIGMYHGKYGNHEEKLFAKTNVDGPVVYGYNGGALGTKQEGERIALHWNKDRVQIYKKLDVGSGASIQENGNVYLKGNVGIGVTNTQGSKLAVKGKIVAEEIRVINMEDWADFVFAENYELLPIQELEKSIKNNKHLPGIPSEKEVKEQGIQLGEMQAKLLQKIEELTLYTIQQNKQIQSLQQKNQHLQQEMLQIKKLLQHK
ncbi:hypothetical protein [Candidatus Uabimicrobium amorphum]|uniref:Peptidase S74 domain-containing protein n=1 Tax=Uabimicrobium amorphum TaxID=2596890 RepID=A0A5S9F659_UABAM|nr:hypothetical protein [Candidatus Uabimicrobium amorphum]BBM86319.1 hypothetical protein UABAM_04705 [Candidatus Uabimicrobium amorphum]